MKMNLPVFLGDSPKEKTMRRILFSNGIKTDSVYVKEMEFFDIYDVRLSLGTKPSRLEKALPNIGLSLKSTSTPRGYPVMSEGIFRIEAQTKEIESFSFSKVINSESDADIKLALGRMNSGEAMIGDLGRLPNLLIGGIPGSGKSVLLHSIIISLLTQNTKLYLVDPKIVEFEVYRGYSGVEQIITDVDDFLETINSLTEEMEKRFQVLRSYGSRNIFDLNKKLKKKLPYIALVIDEWADLVLQNKKIQLPMCRLSQKGRAAGISVILATQRPSSRIIDGLIKASFSGRIAMRVASPIDSRIVLDRKGAEHLNSVGSGLYLDQYSSEPIGFRAPFISDIEFEIKKAGIQKKKNSFWSYFF